MDTRRRDLTPYFLAVSRRPTNPPRRIRSGLIFSKFAVYRTPIPLQLILFDRGYDVGYIATIQVGTPPRDYSILMDSGSADFWIGGEKCKSSSTDGGCVRMASVHSITIRSDTALPLRVIMPFSENILHPLSKTQEKSGRPDTILVQSKGVSSLITSTSPVWL